MVRIDICPGCAATLVNPNRRELPSSEMQAGQKQIGPNTLIEEETRPLDRGLLVPRQYVECPAQPAERSSIRAWGAAADAKSEVRNFL